LAIPERFNCGKEKAQEMKKWGDRRER